MPSLLSVFFDELSLEDFCVLLLRWLALLLLEESESESEEPESEEDEDESITVENSWRGDNDSDDDSVDSEMENPLKYAGAYSAEEVIRIMRDKLIRLQKLYIDQFQR